MKSARLNGYLFNKLVHLQKFFDMLSIFKSKPELVNLIPNDFVDIHSHILPGIDDGAKNINDSDYLLNSMKNMGFKKVITTPHTMKNVWNNTSETIQNSRKIIETELAELHQTLNLQAASEYFIDEHFVELFKTQPLLTLKDNYVLVEMSYLNPPIPLHEYLFELQLAGYQPILAHPERYVYYHHNFNDYEKLKKMGCYFQVNLLSTVGYYGKDVAIAADKLLQADMINFAGSDIHHKQHIDSFKRKTVIKSNKQLEKVIENNQFFK